LHHRQNEATHDERPTANSRGLKYFANVSKVAVLPLLVVDSGTRQLVTPAELRR
jgi:hypothetical protein